MDMSVYEWNNLEAHVVGNVGEDFFDRNVVKLLHWQFYVITRL